MPRERDNRILVELIEECARTLAQIEGLEEMAQRRGFKRDCLKLAKANVGVLKSQAMEAIQDNQ